MISNLLKIYLLLLLVSYVSSFYIKPLVTGTVQIQDQHIRLSKKIERHIVLDLKRDYYESHKDIEYIASITSLQMDQKLSFYFVYNIICPSEDCFLNITLIRYTDIVNLDFKYNIKIDYLVAHGLKISHVNVTSFQTHVQLRYVRAFDENNNNYDLNEKLPKNTTDAWYMMLYPNGWNNVTLTGHMVYSYIPDSDSMYVIHYMDHSNGHGEHDQMGWPQDGNFILYTIVFLPQQYLANYNCQPDQKFRLNDNYERVCNGGNNVEWFYGFKGTKQVKIQGQFFKQKSGFSFKLGQTPSRYGLMAFPFEISDKFIDIRTHQYKWEVEYSYLGWIIGIIIGICLALGIAILTWLLLRKCHFLKRFSFGKIGNRKTLHEEVVSELANDGGVHVETPHP